ncbi:MAG: prepilin peptidase [Patescibacteria group bacterium]|nr:A24 family peptidase [Patescibacteria group bacterium]MDE1941398.1 prepilin peptidase [Patescibacteria group bacterium]MDE1966616.1 prepilin peptidase [Patescibacteria group bacterium]
MDTLSIILSFVFGAAIGSFLNVVSLRFNTGATLGGRSKCMSCSKQLSWFELVPVFSFAAQKGKCRGCSAKISWQYPLVEFIAGAIFVLIIYAFPPLTIAAAFKTFIYLAVTCLLLVIAAYDIKHKIIPDPFVYAFIGISLASLFVGGHEWFRLPGYSAILAGPALALPFALIWLFSKGAWMGLGDAKLVLGIGWLLGLNRGLNALILAFWIAAFFSVLWLFVTYRRFKPRTEIPFAPYLIIGMYLVLIFGLQVLDINILRQILFG